jgi:hypothetical protein
MEAIMIRKFELCSLRLVGFANAKAETHGGIDGVPEEDGSRFE